ncbi:MULTISPECIES: metallophosphoesterase [unclassified Crossiella]|uniref:metallophosphoesterase family protein n=1 Tax=unclassified Crossiella TaxID=2620835 RepID=UPI0020002225|nr:MULTISPECIES: metallophosphoesterase family protein [unclassified Crossiella]MCK2239343.1 metallophosphatase family protein [Crossiella sp. S99.2]MCK2252038.1 metallophosphatase family protein [Crossiella sp. S99.1]
MTRAVAVLSDIHGVLPALEAVLAEPAVRAAERIVLTGDLAAGPMPVETLDVLAGLGDRAVWVRGNADRELVALAADQTLPVPDEICRWAARQLRPEQLTRLAGLPHPVTLDVIGFGPVLFCHGTPREDNEIILVDSPLDRFDQALSTVDESVRTVVCGHTHMPFARLASGRLVVNPGSIGMPYGRTGAHWALLDEGAIQLRRTDFDLDGACRRITAESGYPDAAAWADYYLRARATDREALAVFSRAAT